MANRCKTCMSPVRDDIDTQLINGVSAKVIAETFGIGTAALLRHKLHMLPAPEISEARELSVREQLARYASRVHKMWDATDAWMTDPEDATKYSLEPRAEEIYVITSERASRGVVRRKQRLSSLLAQLESGGVLIDAIEDRSVSPRLLFLQTAKHLLGHTELLARLNRELEPETVDVSLTLNKVLVALSPYPEARMAVSQALDAVVGQ